MKIQMPGSKLLILICAASMFFSLCNTAMAVDETSAQKSFENLAEKWMSKLTEISRTNRSAAARDSSGLLSYKIYGPEKTIWIKKTDSKEAPFLGFIKYSEKSMEKKDLASQEQEGGDTLLNEIDVTEIFRFSNGRWVY